MFLAPEIVICFAAILCLLPLAYYLCWLASINKRSRPTLLTGPWDAVRLIAAVSGFLIVGGVLWLYLLQSDSRFITRGNTAQLLDVLKAQRTAWLATYLGYMSVVVVAAAVLIRSATRSICVYNASHTDLEAAIETALERCGFKAERQGTIWRDGPDPLIQILGPKIARYTTVRLLAEKQREREELEKHFRQAMSQLGSPENPAAAWFVSIGGGLSFFVLMLVFLTFYLMIIR